MLTWTCHVCGDERPDERISVHKEKRHLRNGIRVTQNVRYCNDRSSCLHGAPDVNFLSGAEANDGWWAPR